MVTSVAGQADSHTLLRNDALNADGDADYHQEISIASPAGLGSPWRRVAASAATAVVVGTAALAAASLAFAPGKTSRMPPIVALAGAEGDPTDADTRSLEWPAGSAPCGAGALPAKGPQNGSPILDLLATRIGMKLPGSEDPPRAGSPCPLGAGTGGAGCSGWGEDCTITGCCKEEGHQCYFKNFSFATCLPQCSPGELNWFDDEESKWTCEPHGQRTPGEVAVRMVERPPAWARPGDKICASWGENCGAKGCCSEEGHQCYVRNDTYAACLPECTSPSWFEEEAFQWKCTTLGQRTPGKAKIRPVEHVPRWVGETCAKLGQDCSEQKCCSEPGQQCYESEGGSGQCMWACAGGTHLHDERMRNWTCNALGPRTPGKIHKDKQGDDPLPAWVKTQCSKKDEDCTRSMCCAAPGNQCFRKNASYAACQASCPPVPDLGARSDFAVGDWGCDPVGPRTPGGVASATSAGQSLRYEDLPSWVASECSSAEDSCSSTRCCKDPEMQCYERQKGEGFCRKLCLHGMVLDGKAWSCKELGPRTPVQCPSCAPDSVGAPDVVIPFFERDLCKLKYTAKAISTNDPDHHLGNVFLMWVSERRVEEFQGEIDEILASIRETREATLMDFTDRMHQTQPKPLVGWFAQQVVKLKAASVVQSDFYVILDSKNTLIHKLEQNPFFTSCNQAYIQAEFTSEEMGMPHIEWYELSANALGLPSPKAESWPDSLLWPASITPMVMHRQTVLDMLQTLNEGSSLDSLCQGQLCSLLGPWTDSGHGATEFTLYTLYVYSLIQSENFQCIHSIDPIRGFKVDQGEDWLVRLQAEIVESDLRVHPEQMVMSNKDGWPAEWPFTEVDSIPTDMWPLSFTDLTRKWSASLWRGEPQDASKLAAENLRVLKSVIDGTMISPLMFGAQPASLQSMDDDQQQKAIELIFKLYGQANLVDGSESDFIGCIVGYHN